MSDEAFSRADLLGAIIALFLALGGWIYALFSKVWGSGHKSADIEIRLTDVESAVLKYEAWRDNLMKEHIQIQMYIAKNTTRLDNIERELFRNNKHSGSKDDAIK